MRISFHFIQLSLIFILFSSCGDVLSDYDKDSTNPLDIDNEICTILNEKQGVSAHIFINNDSLINENLYSLLVKYLKKHLLLLFYLNLLVILC